jgi:hypothetical protein
MKMNQFDILLIHTKYCPISWLIRKYTHSEWNHCVFILNSKEIMDCKSTGLKIRPLKSYLSKFYKVKLLRLDGLTEKDKLKISAYMALIISISQTKHLTKSNYFKFLKTLFLILINHEGTFPTFTCSSFISTCLELGAGFYIDIAKYTPNITPEDINSNPNFKEVIE